MKEARIRAYNSFGLELRYAMSKDHVWPGTEQSLGRAGYWLGTATKHVWVGQSVNPDALNFSNMEQIPMDTKRGNLGYGELTDGLGRPLKVRAPVRNRLASVPGGDRRIFRRTIVNISWVDGTATWLFEDIDISFRALGYAKFPGCDEFDLVALEVVGGVDKGWVRIDRHSVEYGDST